MTPAHITITPVHIGDLLGVDMPIYVHLVDHPDARVLVDTGLTQPHPLVADLDPRIRRPDEWGFDPDSVDIVVNTHLHFDHCGGNHRYVGKPVFVQRHELDDARTLPDYTIRDWVDPPDAPVHYVAVDGELDILPGVRLMPAPGHTRGSQILVAETATRRVVIAGDTAVEARELDEPTTEGQQLVRALDPDLVWISHVREPWRRDAGRSGARA